MKKPLLLTFLLSLALISCNKENTQSTYIPKDAIAVTYIDLNSISKKANEIDLKELNINDIIKDKAPAEINDFIATNITAEKIASTFKLEHVFAFSSFKRMSALGGLILPIKSSEAFEDFITPMLEKAPDIVKEDNDALKSFTLYSNNNLAIGWNDNTALLIFAKNNASDELIKLTKLEKTENISATPYFKNFLNSKEDIGIHVTSTPIADVFAPMLSSMAGVDLDMSNNSITYFTSFEKDHIHGTYSLKLNKDIESLFGYKLWLNTNYNKDLLKALPNNPLVLGKLSIDTKALYTHINSLKNNTVIPKEFRVNIKKGIEKINSEAKRDLNVSFEGLFEMFDGSLIAEVTEGKTIKDSVAVYNGGDEPESYTHFEKNIPNFYVAVSIANTESLNKILNVVSQNNKFTKQTDTHYIIDEEAHLVINNNIMLITNDVENANDFNTNKAVANNLSDFDHKSKLDHSGYLFSSNNLQDLSSYFQSFTPYGSYGPVNNINEIQEKMQSAYTKYFSENHFYFDTKSSESFVYTKGDKNALVQLILYIDELAQSFAEMN